MKKRGEVDRELKKGKWGDTQEAEEGSQTQRRRRKELKKRRKDEERKREESKGKREGRQPRGCMREQEKEL